MTVYLDTAFAVNGSVNYLLLLSAAYLAGAPLRRGRFLLGGGARADSTRRRPSCPRSPSCAPPG